MFKLRTSQRIGEISLYVSNGSHAKIILFMGHLWHAVTSALDFATATKIMQTMCLNVALTKLLWYQCIREVFIPLPIFSMVSLHNQSQGCVIVALFGIEYKKDPVTTLCWQWQLY